MFVRRACVKSKITSTKLQINLKFQHSMTKAFEIWNLGHCYLFDIWDLLFGIPSTPAKY